MINQRLKKIRHASFRVWGLTDRKKIARIVNISKKIQETNFVFSKISLFLSFFPLCFFSAYYSSFALLTIIMTTKWQSTHINKTSNINKLITISSWRTQDTLHLHKKWSFPLRISPVNVTKSVGNCGFGHIHWRNR